MNILFINVPQKNFLPTLIIRVSKKFHIGIAPIIWQDP